MNHGWLARKQGVESLQEKPLTICLSLVETGGLE